MQECSKMSSTETSAGLHQSQALEQNRRLLWSPNVPWLVVVPASHRHPDLSALIGVGTENADCSRTIKKSPKGNTPAPFECQVSIPPHLMRQFRNHGVSRK